MRRKGYSNYKIVSRDFTGNYIGRNVYLNDPDCSVNEFTLHSSSVISLASHFDSGLTALCLVVAL